MPFIHLERELWPLRDAAGNEIGPDASPSRKWLAERGALGQLCPEVERLLADPATLAAAARLLLDHFTPALAALICDAVGLDLLGLETAAAAGQPPAGGRPPGMARRAGFAEEVLRAYAYQCAVCGFSVRGVRLRWGAGP